MIVEFNYNYMNFVNVRISIRVNVLHGGRAGDTFAIKIIALFHQIIM